MLSGWLEVASSSRSAVGDAWYVPTDKLSGMVSSIRAVVGRQYVASRQLVHLGRSLPAVLPIRTEQKMRRASALFIKFCTKPLRGRSPPGTPGGNHYRIDYGKSVGEVASCRDTAAVYSGALSSIKRTVCCSQAFSSFFTLR